MIYVYLVAAAAALPLLDNFINVFHRQNSWWQVPLIFIGIFLVLIILHLCVLAVSIALVDMKAPSEKHSRYYRALIGATLPMLFKLARVHIHTTGVEKVPQDGKFLLVCNHTHDIDPAVIINELPKEKLGFIAKKEIYTDMRFVAKAMHKLHCLPIDRENNRNAVETIVNAIKLIKGGTVSVGVFPEGYTSLDGKLHEFRNGVFKIALKAQCPVVVCTLVGVRAAVRRLFLHRTDIYFDIVETILPEEIAGMSTSEIGERVHRDMSQSLANRNAEVQEPKKGRFS